MSRNATYSDQKTRVHVSNKNAPSTEASRLHGEHEEIAARIERRLPQKEEVLALFSSVKGDVSKAMRDNPALLPAATGALGFATGMLIGSRLTRVLLLVGVGAAVSELVKNGGLDKLKSAFEQRAATS